MAAAVVAAAVVAALAGALYIYDAAGPSPVSEKTVMSDHEPMALNQSKADVQYPTEKTVMYDHEPMTAAAVVVAATGGNKTVEIPQDMADANNAFAVEFYRTASDNNDDNVFFSPTSMHVAFSIAYEGARENTALQMKNTFGFEADSQARHNATAHMMASINRENPYFELDIANALWISVGYPVYDEYTQIARETYLAGIERLSFVDLDDDGKKIAVKRINQWASDNTNGKIDDVVNNKTIPDSTVMVINNAVYFNGTWVTQFPKDDTREGDFWKSDASTVQTDFMNVRGMFDYYDSQDGVQVLRMPYKGDRLSMLVVLPDDIESLDQSLSAEQIALWRQGLLNQDVIVSVPKFEFKTNYKLKKLLPGMGITDIFSEKHANFTGIIPRELMNKNLYVSDALHDAYVDVNEVGTEAAAVTTIIFADEDAPPPPPVFTADRPFVFLIQDDESGTILFMGRVSDPAA